MSYQLHLQTKLIAIKRIDLPYDQTLDYFGYAKTQIDRGAELFLEAKGIINPLVVRRTNNYCNGVAIDEETPDGRYEVISGFLEYFCVKRAKEIRPEQECVQAIILNSSLSVNLLKQIELFRIGAESFDPGFDPCDDDDDLDFELVDDRSDNIDDWLATKDDLFGISNKLVESPITTKRKNI